MRKLLLAAIMAAAIGPVASAQGVAKKRVAVFDFDNAGVPGQATSLFMTSAAPPNLGKTVANLVVARLVKDGAATVIERAELEKLLAEQNLTNSDRTDPLTAARLGRILGVDMIVLGSITHYDYEDKMTGGGGSRLGGLGGFSMSSKHDVKAIVKLAARLISPDTAEVLAVSDGAGEIVKKGVKVDMRDTSNAMGMGGGAAGNPIMSEAMDKAIAQLGGALGPVISKLPARTPTIDGLVADSNESGRLVLNVGSNNGVKTGERLQVWRAGKEIRDPSTGKLLMRDDTLLGEATVTTVNEISSIATFNGTQPVKSGDIVKSPRKQP